MYSFKRAAICFFSCAVAFSFSACEKEALTDLDLMPASSKTINQRGEIGGYIPNPGGENLPQPTIVKQIYIPKNPANAGFKTLAWKITWPTYPAGADEDQIPTVFSTDDGALNSFNYLNSVDSTETYKMHFSLYFDNRVLVSNDTDLWAPLTYLDFYSVGSSDIDNTALKKINTSPAIVEDWVKNNPGILASEMGNDANSDYEYDDWEPYQAGDIYIYQIYKHDEDKPFKYGVIRIVSMSPRVIEVYLAVPNINDFSITTPSPFGPGN
ncbi:hypothetical protein GXP67_26885 [Rhodocytophaga rosea]|uniref:Uncharacterized protein n=1 Tax=Rhodocytophaga rosea TaxID=2704465 RepID=A0A6C0GR21_9BACT|nr:hypothetical protein [Rhodocytophaga rosea]QHT70012.1 hypothetical protein GXP67_26885 [Rhodocytophaga rosea]